MRKTMREITVLWNRACGIVALILLALQFVPFWTLKACESCGLSKNFSLTKFIWFGAKDADMLNFLESKVGEVNVNLMAASNAAMVLCLVAGVFFCFRKSEKGILAIVPAFGALAGILTFAINPAFRTGKAWIGDAIVDAIVSDAKFMKPFLEVAKQSWVIEIFFCAIVVILAVIVIIYDFKRVKQESVGNVMSSADKAAKITAIRTLTTEVGTKKGSIAIAEGNFNKLIAYLSDPDEDCRIAAVEMLGKTSKEFAFTHIAHLLEIEESEKVANAMRTALKSIKVNMEK